MSQGWRHECLELPVTSHYCFGMRITDWSLSCLKWHGFCRSR